MERKKIRGVNNIKFSFTRVVNSTVFAAWKASSP